MVFVVYDWAHYVGTIEAVATAAIVVLAVVVQSKGLAALQRHRAIEAPAVLQRLHASSHPGQFIHKDPGEAMGDVEIRGTLLGPGVVTVLGLGGIDYEILKVARVVQ